MSVYFTRINYILVLLLVVLVVLVIKGNQNTTAMTHVSVPGTLHIYIDTNKPTTPQGHNTKAGLLQTDSTIR